MIRKELESKAAKLQFLKDFTENHRENYRKDKALCEAKAYTIQLPFYLSPIKEGDLFAGRYTRLPLGFSPQVNTDEGGFGYYHDEKLMLEWFAEEDLTSEDRDILKSVTEYWLDKTGKFLTRQAYPDWVEKALPSDNWTTEPGIAFPLYRMAGSQLDFGKLVQIGIPGLEDELLDYLNNAKDKAKIDFYKAGLLAIDNLRAVISYFIENTIIQTEALNKDRKRLIYSLNNLLTRKPGTLHEASQLMFLYAVISGSQNYGRIDEYLGGFLENDLEAGILTKNEALEMVVSLFRIMDARGTIYDGRAIVGGKGRKDEKAADQFALLAMKASAKSRTVLPQLTLRFYKGMDQHLYDYALKTVGKGWVYPMLYNDDININSVSKSFNISANEAQHYLPYGCGEYVLYHRSFGTPSGIINLPKALEITINNGIDPLSGSKMGVEVEQISRYDSFEELYSAYSEQVEYHVKALALQEKIEYDTANESAPFMYFSMLFDDCLEKGKPVFGGGAKFLGGTLETYGNTTVADSLTAIKKLVYEKQLISLQELHNSLLADFSGKEDLQALLLDQPKYGNDDKEADEMLVRVHDDVCNYTMNQAVTIGLDYYLVVVINNDANTDLGKQTIASADGRNAFSGLNNGNSPSVGKDKNGITALLNSLVKPATDIHAGAVQNMKFSQELFRKHPDKVKSLLDTYFDNGGAQAMLTVVNKTDLEKAMENPENYSNLFVRVGGFSARFVDLRKEVQLEILHRTLY